MLNEVIADTWAVERTFTALLALATGTLRRCCAVQVVFLFTDAHVVNEGFLEFINNILISAMVPSLFQEEEKERLRTAVRNEVKPCLLSQCVHREA